MIPHSFPPYVLQPTRVTDHSATIIDNIFSNVTDYDTSGGNITTLISDHFAQFLMIKKCHVSYKSCNYSVSDYSNFGKESLFTIIRTLNGHPFVIQVYLSMNISIISIRKQKIALIFMSPRKRFKKIS